MPILQSSASWVLDNAHERLGDPYVYGGVYSPTDTSQGCDCSGAVGWVLEALTKTPPNMGWGHVVSTESWYYNYGSNTPAAPGTVGPYGTIAVANLSDIPPTAALTIDIMHGGGGEDSHMNCQLQGVIIESNGDQGSCTNHTGAYPIDASLWTDHWYLPGPIVDNMASPLFYPDVSNNNWSSNDQLIEFLSQLHGEGFVGVVHKVSEGNSFSDPYWRPCRAWCEQNNLSWLGYHYCTTDDPSSQAAEFLRNNGGGNVMLDFEQAGDISNFWALARAFNNVGVNVSMAYIPEWYWQRIGNPDLSPLTPNEISLVSSDYPSERRWQDAKVIYADAGGNAGPGWSMYGGVKPVCWQFSDSVTIAGVTVDCNAYYGLGPNLDALFTGAIYL